MSLGFTDMAKQALLIGFKSVPIIGKAADFYEAIENASWKIDKEGRLIHVEKGLEEARSRLRFILETLRSTNMDGETLSSATRSLFDLEQQTTIKTAFFEQLLYGSRHLNELKKNPQNYGRVLMPDEMPEKGKIHLIIEADRKRIVEVAPIAFATLLSSQKNEDPSVRILNTSESLLAFPNAVAQNFSSTTLPSKFIGPVSDTFTPPPPPGFPATRQMGYDEEDLRILAEVGHYRFGSVMATLNNNNIVIPAHPNISFDEQEFLTLLRGSISLQEKKEKSLMIAAIPRYAQYQIDDLLKIFKEEQYKLRQLPPKELKYLQGQEYKCAEEWKDLQKNGNPHLR